MIKTLVGGWGNTTAGALSFNSLWKTDNAGTSTTSQITVPTASTGTYSCTVYWGDGTSNTITTYNDAAWTHTYPSPGVYLVRIVGTFKGINFNNGGDRLKLLNISNWGGFSFGNTGAYFYGCVNLTITATDQPGMVGTTSMMNAFRSCTALRTVPNLNAWDMSAITTFQSMFVFCTFFNQDISGWNTSSATNLQSMFQSASAFNQNISSWNTSNVTNMSTMFFSATSFNQNLGAWNITKLVSGASGGTGMFTNATLSNANYNGLLAGWGAQVPLTNVTFSGGNSHYDSTSGGYNGTAGRAVLTGTYTWTITDGGTP
jgi:surface protein